MSSNTEKHPDVARAGEYLTGLRAGTGQREAPVVPPAEVLLTGATGFLGVYVLTDLLRKSSARVTCLVRADSEASGARRIREAAAAYGLDSHLDLNRITVLTGDLSKPEFANPRDFRSAAERVDAVIHCAAAVNFTVRYPSLRPSTVDGTTHVLELCMTGKAKRFHYVSSVAVFESPELAGRTVDEGTRETPFRGVALGYSQSKWVAERIVWQAAESSLPVTVYRPPLIAGDSVTGAWSRSDFLIRLLRGCVKMGVVPVFDFDLDATPVDTVSAAIAASVTAEEPPQVLHLNNHRQLPWEKLPEVLAAAGIDVATVSFEEWIRMLREQQGRSGRSPLYPFHNIFLGAIDGTEVFLPQIYRRSQRPRILNERSRAFLRARKIEIPALTDLLGTTYAALLSATASSP
ncbi:MAG: NAD-dependent epimerase/dehydratase family protein [Spirochaetes bacterium]|nr:NAD-dependent epimerase/dehydratase family protein [Spirochaetota bacterium]